MSARDLIDLQISLFRGVAENIDIPLLAKDPVDIIRAGDELLSCLEFNTESAIATMKDVTANISVSRNGYITNSVAPTSTAWRGLLAWVRQHGGDHIIDYLDLKVKVVTGGAAAAQLTCAGTEVGDTILFVGHLTTLAAIASMEDITHLCSIPAAGKIAASIDTTNDQLWVFYHDVNGTSAIDIPNLKFALADGAADGILTVTGIATADSLLFAGLFETKAAIATLLDDTANCTITGANQVTSTTVSTGDQYLIIYHDVA